MHAYYTKAGTQEQKMEECLPIADLHSASQSQALEILDQIARLEKKTFPLGEAFNFKPALWQKPDARVLYVCVKANTGSTTTTTTTVTTSNNITGCTSTTTTTTGNTDVVAYLLYMCGGESDSDSNNIAYLRKLCVAAPYRRRGIGEHLLRYTIRERRARKSSQNVQLWIDGTRVGARSLFAKCAFELKEEVPNFYAEGRTGFRMVLGLK